MKPVKVLLLIGDYSSKKAMIYYRIVHDCDHNKVQHEVLEPVHHPVNHIFPWTWKRTTFELLGFTIIELGCVCHKIWNKNES